MTLRLGVTPGEPAGIGPDICITSLETARDIGRCHGAEFVYYADPDLISSRASALGKPVRINRLDQATFDPGSMNIHPVKLAARVKPGITDTDNAAYVMETLSRALADCRKGHNAAMVTGPVNKAVIIEAGYAFSGHTEWLAQQTRTRRVVMMLAAGNLRVALATTHLPLAKVSAAITREMLEETILIVYDDLHSKFGIARPRIAVCGLNPHAGEGGHLGQEEIDTITPTIRQMAGRGLRIIGPVPADTAFTPAMLSSADAVLAMYHDQGLPVIKHAAFTDAVNITLGLPIIRTSVDHGTALDLAGSGRADHVNLLAAMRTALELAGRTAGS